MSFNQYVNDNVLDLSSQRSLEIHQLITFLQSNTNIEHLHLRSCGIDSEGAEALAKSQHLENLTTLHLEENFIGPKGAEDLANSEHLRNLTTLHLERNFIGPKGAEDLANSEHLRNLTTLHLEGNNIRDEGAKAFINALNDGKFPSLTILELSDNDIGDKVKKELDAALKSNIEHARRTNNINISPSNPEKKNDIPHSTKGNKLPIITASAGLLLGSGIAYFAGAAALTIAGAVTLFITAAVVGTLVGYGVGKFCEKISSKFSDVSTKYSELQMQV